MKEKKPSKQFKAIEVHCTNPNDIFSDNRLEISKAIVEAIDFALKNKRKKVVFAQVIIKNIMAVTLSVEKREFMDLLNQNLEILVELEEYEMCALIMKLKNKLTKTTKKVDEEIEMVI